MNTLVVGGTSGLGLELAKNYQHMEDQVFITGRHDPGVEGLAFHEFDLNQKNLPKKIGSFIADLPDIDGLIYAAGFYQEGHITKLTDEQVDNMINVGGRGLIFFVKKLLEKQNYIDVLTVITSTSEWVPREFEPVYNFVKAGAGHYANGQSLDARIQRTLRVGTSGMKTDFWEGTDKDTSMMMEPSAVADRIMEQEAFPFIYRYVKILGDPNGDPKPTEIVETR